MLFSSVARRSRVAAARSAMRPSSSAPVHALAAPPNPHCATYTSLSTTPSTASLHPLTPPSPRLAPSQSRPFSSLSLSSVNPRVVSAQYAVRGELVLRAEQIKKEIAQAVSKGLPSPYPFTSIVQCNIGNPQELGQKPLTFPRQVLSLCHYPDAISTSSFPSDAIQRAKEYLSEIPSTGAYTPSSGLRLVREQVAAFIAQRDGHPADPDTIFLTDGASTGVKHLLSLIVRSEADAVLTPVPQYPLYSATLTLLGGTAAPYYLLEQDNWGLDTSELTSAISRARSTGREVRALVVINPGNPTGNVLSRSTMESVVRICQQEGLVLLADEVYQENVYVPQPFISFKRVVSDLAVTVPLISFHSTSKGLLGECGQRGGYMEIVNVPQDVMAQVYKLASVSLCSNTSGQIMTGLMVRPPTQGQPSYNRHQEERAAIFHSLKRRADTVWRVLNSCTGVSCEKVQGAMYAFPTIRLPARAIEEARKAGKAADTFYCLRLLEETGLVTVPGSGFGQREGTWHFRVTILPREEQLTDVLQLFKTFNDAFMDKYK